MEKLALVGASAQGVSQFEKDRLKRIEENKKRMSQMMAGADISLLVRQPQVTPARPKKRKAEVVVTSERRKSSRISNMPTPLYCIDEDSSDRTPASRSRASSGPTGRHFHGIAATPGDTGDDGDLYMSGKKGWKLECGSASLEAADAATDAAVALQRKIVEAGGHASVKLMSASQVSGGFWSQLPYDITTHYGNSKRTIYLHCDDKAHQDPTSLMYSVPHSSTCWPVVYLPKQDNQGFGLSGGWRGFAIDMRLFPNDTVVHEVLDCEPGQSTCAAGGASNLPSSDEDSNTDCGLSQESAKATTAAGGGSAAAGGGGGVKVLPQQRMHLRVHIFRASAFEKTDTAAAAAAEGGESASQQQSQQADIACLLLSPLDAAAGELLLGSDSQEQQQQNNTQLCRSGSAEDSTTTAAAAVGDDDSLDLPLAKRAKRVIGAAAAGVPRSAAAVAAGKGVDLMEAAEAGLVRGVKVLRQSSRIKSSSKKGAGGGC